MKESSNLVDLCGIKARIINSETRCKDARATAAPFTKIPRDRVYPCFSVSAMSGKHFEKGIDKCQNCIMPRCGRKESENEIDLYSIEVSATIICRSSRSGSWS